MTCIRYFPSAPPQSELPQAFPSPFSGRPHPLARQACVQLQESLAHQADWRHDFERTDGGKMLGVLVVRDRHNKIGFLTAFSGMLAGQWVLPGFVPPVFDGAARDDFLSAGEAELERCSKEIRLIEEGPERKALLLQWQQLGQQRDADLVTLKAVHQRRKELRHAQREYLDQALSDVAAMARDKILARLSFESQQDRREKRQLSADWGLRLAPVQRRLADIDEKIEALKKGRAHRSQQLHKKVFSTYTLTNVLGERKNITAFFDGRNPPGGSGDCAAPKLIHYAHQQGLMPLALAEFWWGASPSAGVRHHGYYYPACRGKCGPILPFMLEGVNCQKPPILGGSFDDADAPVTVYEDDVLLVVNKPSGLLSVPGKEVQDSVLMRLRQRYADTDISTSGPLLVHRLDMATSGLLLVAKDRATYKALQKQFLRRSIDKRYVAVLCGRLMDSSKGQGIIELPLRVDLDDRPRQRVCFEHGKAATTRWQVIAREQGKTRVYFYPLTGRTHQLRVHAAHKDGLNAAIVGDSLYGVTAERLLLHAERLCFTHPTTGKRIKIEVPAPF